MRFQDASWRRALGATSAFILATAGLAGVAAPAAAEDGGLVEGTVVLPDGANPLWLSDVEIDLWNDDYYDWNYADPETGAFAFEGVPAGEYEVEIEAWEYYDEELGEWTEPNLSDFYGTLTVPEGGISDVVFQLELGRSISGTVTLPAGYDAAALAAVEVWAESEDDEAYGSVDPETGAYELTGLSDGEYVVGFEVDEYYDEQLDEWITPNLLSEIYEDVRDWSEATPVVIDGGSVTGIDAALEEGLSISGVVDFDEDVEVGLGQQIQVYAFGVEFDWQRSATVDLETGEYTITGLPAGAFVVSFEPIGYYDSELGQYVWGNILHEYYDDARNWDDATEVVVDGDVTGIDATLSRGRTVSGTVTKPESFPLGVSNVLYAVAFDADGEQLTSVNVRGDGTYVMMGLPHTEVTVRFDVNQYFDGSVGQWVYPNIAPEYYDDAASFADATFVSLASGDATGIDAVLEEGRTISGVVTLEEGLDPSLLAGAYVDARELDGVYFRRSATVDPTTGAYEITGLGMTEYAVEFRPEGTYSEELDRWIPSVLRPEFYDDAASLDAATPVDVSAESATGIDAELALGGTITGTVTAEDGAPEWWAEEVAVVAYGLESGAEVFTELEDDGTYAMYGLADDDYIIEFYVYLGGYEETRTTPLQGEFFDDAAEWDDATPVTASGGVTVTGIDAELTFDGPAPELTLTDIEGNPFQPEILWLAETGITTGWETAPGFAEFRPLENINRDQMAAFLYRLAGEPEFTVPETPTFSDVPASQPFFTEIEWLAHEGITNGWTVGGVKEFRPTTSVNRDMMAAFLYRFDGSPEFEGTGQTFIDVPTTHVFYDEIEWLATQGITNGWTVEAGKEFRPATPVKRDVMAAFIYRFSHRVS